tara:strand:- start:864 stop:1592 length:729 start_codon:yes stop_codon:yes gene_type:complete
MGRAKEIILKVIPSKIANEFVKKHHYSGKVVPNSKLHFGAFLDNKLHGVMSYGSSMDKRKTLTYCDNTLWNEFLELNRMAFDDYLPKYSESRCIAISIKLIKKNAPHIKWIISFADGTMCGDGTIYRASGFKLIKIGSNSTIYEFPDGVRISTLTLTNSGDLQSRKKICKKYGAEFTSKASMKPFIDIGAKKASGFMLGYIYLIDKTCKIRVPVIPFSEIDKKGAGMYKGEKITLQKRRANN